MTDIMYYYTSVILHVYGVHRSEGIYHEITNITPHCVNGEI